MTITLKRLLPYFLVVGGIVILLISAVAALNPLGDSFCYDVPGNPHYEYGDACL